MSAIFASTVCAAFRQRTEAQKMLGAASIPALAKCHCCNKRRTVKTGSYNKAGNFICGQCRPVFARIADKKNPGVSGATTPIRDQKQLELV